MGGLGSEVGMVVGEVLGHEHGHRPSVPVLANERELLFHKTDHLHNLHHVLTSGRLAHVNIGHGDSLMEVTNHVVVGVLGDFDVAFVHLLEDVEVTGAAAAWLQDQPMLDTLGLSRRGCAVSDGRLCLFILPATLNIRPLQDGHVPSEFFFRDLG